METTLVLQMCISEDEQQEHFNTFWGRCLSSFETDTVTKNIVYFLLMSHIFGFVWMLLMKLMKLKGKGTFTCFCFIRKLLCCVIMQVGSVPPYSQCHPPNADQLPLRPVPLLCSPLSPWAPPFLTPSPTRTSWDSNIWTTEWLIYLPLLWFMIQKTISFRFKDTCFVYQEKAGTSG